MDVPQTPFPETLVPAGWYQDPADQARHRWWDGSVWTDHVTPLNPPEPVAGLAASSSVTLDRDRDRDRARATQDLPSGDAEAQNVLTRRQLREQVGSLVTGEVDGTSPLPRQTATFEAVEPPWSSDPFGDSAYVPMRPVRFPQPKLPPRRQSSSTLAVWLYAVSPLWIGFGAWAVGKLGVFPPNGVALVGGIVGLALAFALASTDRKRLAARGFDPTASPAWVLLPLVYFIVRTVRVGRGGLGPLILYVLLQCAVIVIAVAAALAALPVGTSGDLSPTQRAEELTPTGMATKLRTDLEQVGRVIGDDLVCQPLSSMESGTVTTCADTEGGVPTTYQLKVSPEEPRVAFVLVGVLKNGS